jgi:hypothetical protein
VSENRRKAQRILLLALTAVLAASLAAAAQEAVSATASPANKAAKVALTASSFEKEAGSRTAPPGKVYLILDSEWTNIHPKQKVEKSKLEGKQDRTMGVGGLMGGRSDAAKKEELVEVDVAYVVPSLRDHAYVLADGESFALDELTGTIAGGVPPDKGLSLPKQGDVKKVRLVYAVPEKAKNLAFRFFDYSYGHILIPVKGSLTLAAGSGPAPAKGAGFGRIEDETLELTATAIDFGPSYADEEAPAGWRYAVVKLSGKSLSAGGSAKNIVQIEPREYVWLTTAQGHLYYARGGSTTDQGYIRFTPDFFQSQEVAFLVPDSEKAFSLGLRLQNRVHALALTAPPPAVPPAKALARHADGDTLEIFLFGARREKGLVILDLGIRSLVSSGAEIQPEPQFIIEAGGEDVTCDEDATDALAHRPPEPFIVPPMGFVRFELAYATSASPSSLRYRGFRSEARLAVAGVK